MVVVVVINRDGVLVLMEAGACVSGEKRVRDSKDRKSEGEIDASTVFFLLERPALNASVVREGERGINCNGSRRVNGGVRHP